MQPARRGEYISGVAPLTFQPHADARIMLIGLDSADADLIETWCAAGYLPNLQALRQQGIWGRLGTSAEVMHVSAWPSVYTGTLPGKHGMYHAYQMTPGEQEVHRTRADECGQTPFWEVLDRAGKRCIIMDAFMNYPLDEFQGIQILEYGTWTWFAEPMATPSHVWKELLDTFGPYPVPEHSKVLKMPEPQEFRRKLMAGADLKGQIVRRLMGEHPWDLFFVTFAEPHPAGHYLWHLSDSAFPAHPVGGLAGLDNAVRDVYVAVDRAIGDILNDLDDSVSVIITSGDGMGPNYAGCHLLPEVLHRLGLYHGAGVGPARGVTTGSARGASSKRSAASVIRDLIPLGLRRTISRCLPRHLQHQLSMKWANANIDWQKTKAFCLPNANEGYIRVNLAGREPRGIVSRGAGYADLVAELQAHLSELVNPGNGRVAARQVVCNDQVFPGPRRDFLPDVVVNWDIDARVLNELRSSRCGVISGATSGYETAPFYTGNHRPSAFVLARGRRIPADEVLSGGHVIDIAPTILMMLGVDPPAHLDGQAWARFVGQPA